MKKVLILGNGISRLQFVDFINDWKNEIWACNLAFMDFGERISRLTGHDWVLKEAAEYKKKNNLKFEIIAGIHLNNIKYKKVSCPSEFRKDSGTVLVAQALEEGYRVSVVGFDLGGPDVYGPDHQYQNKSIWVRRWRLIAEKYTLDNVEFIGFDHKPFILSNDDYRTYSKYYLSNQPHIPGENYAYFFENVTGISVTPTRHSRKKVRVKYLRGIKEGWVTEYLETVALILERQGKVEILEDKA